MTLTFIFFSPVVADCESVYFSSVLYCKEKISDLSTPGRTCEMTGGRLSVQRPSDLSFSVSLLFRLLWISWAISSPYDTIKQSQSFEQTTTRGAHARTSPLDFPLLFVFSRIDRNWVRGSSCQDRTRKNTKISRWTTSKWNYCSSKIRQTWSSPIREV